MGNHIVLLVLVSLMSLFLNRPVGEEQNEFEMSNFYYCVQDVFSDPSTLPLFGCNFRLRSTKIKYINLFFFLVFFLLKSINRRTTNDNRSSNQYEVTSFSMYLQFLYPLVTRNLIHFFLWLVVFMIEYSVLV